MTVSTQRSAGCRLYVSVSKRIRFGEKACRTLSSEPEAGLRPRVGLDGLIQPLLSSASTEHFPLRKYEPRLDVVWFSPIKENLSVLSDRTISSAWRCLTRDIGASHSQVPQEEQVAKLREPITLERAHHATTQHRRAAGFPRGRRGWHAQMRHCAPWAARVADMSLRSATTAPLGAKGRTVGSGPGRTRPSGRASRSINDGKAPAAAASELYITASSEGASEGASLGGG